MDSNKTESCKGEIILYQPNESLKLEVQIENDTVWLTQQQMAELFLTTKQNVSLHINNIFKEQELSQHSVVKDFLTTASDGKKYKTKYYNLDVPACRQVWAILLQDPVCEERRYGFSNHRIF